MSVHKLQSWTGPWPAPPFSFPKSEHSAGRVANPPQVDNLPYNPRRIPICMAAVWVLLSVGAIAQPARIEIDTDRVVGTVDPMMFGNFIEHLGRCVYGGVYEPGSPLSDADGFRKDVLDAVKGLNVSVLRWPGGNFVSGYNWEDGIGPKDKRPVRRDDAWGAIEPNQFGTDDFLKYCERTGAVPYICINAGLGTVEQARRWVEYCNEPAHTHYADLRRA